MASKLKNRVDRKEREKEGPLTDYAREWAEYTTQQKQRDEREKNVNPVLRKRMERERTVPGPKQQPTDFYYSEHEPRVNSDTDADYNYNVNKARAAGVMREAGRRAYKNKAKSTAENAEKQKKINGVMKNVARKKAQSSILTSSARHQAQQRNGYITENGLDREDAKKSRRELNKTAGETETKNLYKNRKIGVRDFVAERAAQKTKAKQNAVNAMKRVDNEEGPARMDEMRKAWRAMRETDQKNKRAKKW